MRTVGIVAPGHFKRLAAEIGFFHGYYEACQNGFPIPDYMTGVSAGGIAVACAAQWTEEDFRKIEEVLLNLRRSHFYSINPKLEILGGLAALAALSTMLPTDKDTIKNPYVRYGAKAAIALSILGMDKKFVEALLNNDSIFSNKNLYSLLHRELRIKRVFNSPIKLEIASVDINNKVFSTVSNFKPEHQNAETFIHGIVDSTRLPVFFPFRKDKNGNYLADGAAINNVPIHLARNFGCDIIIVLKFKCAGEGPIDMEYNKWTSGLSRWVDISVDENTRKTLRDYEWINNAICQEEKIRQASGLLESLIDEHTGVEDRRKIQEALELLTNVKLPTAGKRKIKLIIVDSEEIPEFHFSNFNKITIRESINIGYRSFWNIKDQIAEAIGQ